MEKPSLDDKMNHALHWDGYGKEHKSKAHHFKMPGIMEHYHDFALWWTPTEYVFYVDGKETWRTDVGGVCQVPLYQTERRDRQMGGGHQESETAG